MQNLICAVTVLAVSSAQAQVKDIRYVDDDAPAGSVAGGDGLSWGTAFTNPQIALAAAAADGSITEIRIAQGVYWPDRDELNPTGTGDRTATFQLLDGVSILGGYAGIGAADPDDRLIDTYVTVLTGDLAENDGPPFFSGGENSYTVVTGSGTGTTAVLGGFTITGGNANGLGRDSEIIGGGMFNVGGSPTVTGCTFSGNWARHGGGMANDGSSPTVTSCTFSGNGAGSSVLVAAGGGMLNQNTSSPTVIDCTFEGNSASPGGGMHNDSSSPTVTNCTFTGNSANYGGGMSNDGSSPTVTDCTFCDNSGGHIDGPVDLSGQIQMSTFCPIPSCPGDITGDGTVGVNDFLDLLAAWGRCP